MISFFLRSSARNIDSSFSLLGLLLPFSPSITALFLFLYFFGPFPGASFFASLPHPLIWRNIFFALHLKII
jgi:hypothetical protein